MAKSKREAEGIDEAALLQSIYEMDNAPSSSRANVQEKPKTPAKDKPDAPKKELPAEPKKENPEIVKELPEQPEIPAEVTEVKEVKEVKEQPVKRKRNQVDYSSLFLQKNELKERSCVYISRRIHNTISEIVRVIADRDVTVGGYIDSVLLQHLEAHRDEINDLYKKERKDLI